MLIVESTRDPILLSGGGNSVNPIHSDSLAAE